MSLKLFVCAFLALLSTVRAYNPNSRWWNRFAFAAIKHDRTAIAWGDQDRGGSEPVSSLTDVVSIVSTDLAFAALKADGTVVNWGAESHGGGNPGVTLNGVVDIFCTQKAFAVLQSDGNIIAWGDAARGGTVPPSGFTGNSYVDVYSTQISFSALYGNGQVVSWGAEDYTETAVLVAPAGLSGIIQIFTNLVAFAGLKADGSVVAWPAGLSGGSAPVISNVVKIFSTGQAFAAITGAGALHVWGHSSFGGGYPRRCPDNYPAISQLHGSNPKYCYLDTDYATAVTAGGCEVWCCLDTSCSCGARPPTMCDEVAMTAPTDVVMVASTYKAFAALRSSGTVVAWGANLGAGVPADLTGVVNIFATEEAFAALKGDGSVVAFGGTSAGVAPVLNNVVYIYANKNAFAALRSDRTVVSWGSGSGGDSAQACPYNYPAISQQQVHGSNPKHCYLDTDYATAVTTGGCEVWCCLDTSCSCSARPRTMCDEVAMTAPSTLKNVISVHATAYAFAALTSDNTAQIIGWGEVGAGGYIPGSQSNVAQIVGNTPFYRSDSSQDSRSYACAAGQHGTRSGSCQDCAIGKYSAHSGGFSADACTSCPAGFTTATTKSTTASACINKVGSYLSSLSGDVLHHCDVGYSTASPGITGNIAAYDFPNYTGSPQISEASATLGTSDFQFKALVTLTAASHPNAIVFSQDQNGVGAYQFRAFLTSDNKIAFFGIGNLWGDLLYTSVPLVRDVPSTVRFSRAGLIASICIDNACSSFSTASVTNQAWTGLNFRVGSRYSDGNNFFPGTIANARLTIGSPVCTVCAAEYYMVSSKCTKCPTGYSTPGVASTGTNESVCTVCAAGYTGTSVAGASGCTSCAKGKYSIAGNGNRCIPCNPGYSTSGSGTAGSDPSACTTCAAGYSGTSVSGTSGCTACAAGYYNSKRFHVSYPALPTLSVSNFPNIASLPSWEIEVNFKSTFRSAANGWRAIIGDMYNDVNTDRGWGIWISESNHIHLSGKNSYWEVELCTVSLNVAYDLKVTKTSNQLTVLLTEKATGAVQSSSTAFSDVLSDDGPVAIGSWNNLSVQPFYGTIFSVAVTACADAACSQCVLCGVGTSKGVGADTACSACTGSSGLNPGFASNEGQAACTACDDHASNCSATDKGTCNAGYTGSTVSSCTACDRGKFKGSAGNDMACTDCNPGYSTLGSGTAGSDASACTTCAAGYTGTSVSGTSGCTACPQGKYGSATPGNGNSCVACGIGYSTLGSGTAGSDASACTVCAPGYSGSSAAGTSGCTACPQGKYGSLVPGNDNTCTDCSTGYTTANVGTIRLPPLPVSPYYRFRGSDYDASTKTWADSSGNTRHIPASSVNGTVLSAVQMAGSNGVTKSFTAVSGDEWDSVTIGNSQMSSYTFCAVARFAGNPKGRIFTAANELNWLTGFHHELGVAYHDGWVGVYTPLPANVDWHVLCDFGANFRWDGLHVGSGGGTVTYLPPLSINIWGAETLYNQRSAWQVADMIIYDRTLSPLEIVDVEANFKYLYGVASMTSTPSSGECSVCEAGYFSVSRGGLSGCEACPIGKYSLAGALTCTNCKVGYSTQQTATGFKHPCRCCAGGYYGTSQIGINGCTICPQGEYQTEGNYTNRCIKCPAGYTTPGMGTPGSDASACSICAGGFESKYVEGTLQCNACPSGTFSKAGQACAGCGKGRYIVIAAPRFNTALESKCHNCVAGKFNEATDATECTACRVGKYMDRIASQVQCEICPAGTIAAATGSTSCTFCPPGKYSTFGSAACVECTAGFYSGKGATVCQSCVAGTYSANAASMCTVCAAGRYSHAYASECFICNAGYFAPMHASRCESCASGTFSAEGAEICSPCPSGTVVAAGGGACETLVV